MKKFKLKTPLIYVAGILTATMSVFFSVDETVVPQERDAEEVMASDKEFISVESKVIELQSLGQWMDTLD